MKSKYETIRIKTLQYETIRKSTRQHNSKWDSFLNISYCISYLVRINVQIQVSSGFVSYFVCCIIKDCTLSKAWFDLWCSTSAWWLALDSVHFRIGFRQQMTNLRIVLEDRTGMNLCHSRLYLNLVFSLMIKCVNTCLHCLSALTAMYKQEPFAHLIKSPQFHHWWTLHSTPSLLSFTSSEIILHRLACYEAQLNRSWISGG